MADWKKVAVNPEDSIKKVVDIIDESVIQVALFRKNCKQLSSAN
ncbi:MAG: hypothetical protein ACQESP_12775 [Candidatus Muiribacteriota bacterium]